MFAFHLAWRRYWFGGRDMPLSAAVCRVAIFTSLLWTWWAIAQPDYAAFLAEQSPALYDPVGLMWLFPWGPPPAWLLQACSMVAAVSAVLAIVGLLTRPSMILATLSSLLLVSVHYSWSTHWSHGQNVVLLAALAFMFAPAGCMLSIDSLIRRWQTQPRAPRASRWPVLLAQFAVAFMFANALYWKLVRSGWAWALSDNLRNSLAVAWYSRGGPPPLADWVISHEWAWKAAATGNLVTQALPLVACFVIRHPLLRALCGAAFVIEVLSLGLLVGLWHFEWLPLLALFIDWDAIKRMADGRWRMGDWGLMTDDQWRTGDGSESADARGSCSCHPPSLYVFAFVGFYVLTACTGADLIHRLYPFSSFPMYSALRAAPPYDEHQPFEFDRLRIEVMGEPTPPPDALARLADRYRRRFDDPARYREHLAAIAQALRDGYGVERIEQLEVKRAIWHVPAYPAPHQPIPVFAALLGRITGNGGFEMVRSCLLGHDDHEPLRLHVQTVGMDAPALGVLTRRIGTTRVRPLPGRWTGDTYRFLAPDPGRYQLLIRADDALSAGPALTVGETRPPGRTTESKRPAEMAGVAVVEP